MQWMQSKSPCLHLSGLGDNLALRLIRIIETQEEIPALFARKLFAIVFCRHFFFFLNCAKLQ